MLCYQKRATIDLISILILILIFILFVSIAGHFQRRHVFFTNRGIFLSFRSLSGVNTGYKSKQGALLQLNIIDIM